LVPEPIDASTKMSGIENDQGDTMAIHKKLDRLLAQVTTMNKRMDTHDQRLARVEATIAEPTDADLLPNADAESGAFSCWNDRNRGGSRGSGGGGHTQQQDSGYRRPNVSFPNYDGESDPLTWLNKCATYFRGMRTPMEERVWMASLHLEGVAAEWFYALERDNDVISWAQFVDFTNLRFGPPIRSNPMAELKDLYRTGTVEEYQRQFCNTPGVTQGVHPGPPLFNLLSHVDWFGQSTSNLEFKVLTKCQPSWIPCPSLSCTSKGGISQNPKANPSWAIGTLIEARIRRSCKPYDHGLGQI
jgi:hypothetical protein